MDFGFASVMAITVICYLIAEIYKAFKLPTQFVPPLCGLAGAILGLVGMRYMPDFPAHDVLNAVAVGIVSGLAATGANQIYKQITKGDE